MFIMFIKFRNSFGISMSSREVDGILYEWLILNFVKVTPKEYADRLEDTIV